MQIFVCVKHVPDSAANVAVVDEIRIDPNLAFLLNPYDEHAVTEAVQLKDRLDASEVIAVCLGPEDAEKTIRSALAMGADRGVLIQTDAVHDSMETARALARVIRDEGQPGIILTGKESIDAEGMQTMFRLGALMDLPVATNAVRLDVQGEVAVVDSERSGGITHTYEMDMPCIVAAGRGLNTPKYPTFPDVVKSKKKPVAQVQMSDLALEQSNAAMQMVHLEPLVQTRDPKPITGDVSAMAGEIVRILRQEAKVIS